MIRQIIIPQQRQFVIELPEEMVGKPTEVIAFNIIESGQSEHGTTKELYPSREEFLAYLRKTGFNAQGWKFNRDEANDYDG